MRNGGGRTVSVGGTGAGAQKAARNHWKGRRLKRGKTGRPLVRKGAGGEGVCKVRGKPERAILGSALHEVEWLPHGMA